jgi:hypothetical protein
MVRKSNKIQYVTVRLKFDQPVTDREAVALFEETISGTFYPKPLARGLGPESFQMAGLSPSGPTRGCHALVPWSDKPARAWTRYDSR